ncbi:MAG: DMT family transporter [Alphaproteobacteria bacterium]|nr:DMT family transporter [Alphaproteobacteria bacterium]
MDRDTRLGAFYMVLSTVILTAQDAIAKWLTADYHAGEILFYRTISGMAVVAWLMKRDGGWRLAVPRVPKLTLLRGGFAVLCSLTIVMSWAVLPLADAMAVVFVSPVMLTIMSAALLGERVGPRGCAAVLIGFVGVLVMMRPSTSAFQWVVIVPLLAAFLSASRDVVTRKLGSLEASTTIFLYSQSLTLAVGGLTLFWEMNWPGWFDWMLFAAAGMMAGIAQYLIIASFRLAPASLVSPLRYLSLVWAVGFGWWLWGDLPDIWIAVGGIMVVVAAILTTRPGRP